ncbi:MAG: sigma-54-dependent Fis family transcriptional regulator, partial [Myxococcaceae bacterium]|nr:sigma-54-dependent Fis family transcriptional regulator [Myxococcaceae bacterium]
PPRRTHASPAHRSQQGPNLAYAHRDLRAMMARGEFREDLYHRLAVFPIRLPSLRERPEDIRPLAEVLLGRIGEELGRRGLRLSPAAATRLEQFAWPGNVRELRNVLERAAILADGAVLEPQHLWLDPTSAPVSAADSERLPDRPLEELERMAIEQAIAAEDGNRKRAAERLGIGLRTLYEKLKRYGLQ